MHIRFFGDYVPDVLYIRSVMTVLAYWCKAVTCLWCVRWHVSMYYFILFSKPVIHAFMSVKNGFCIKIILC